MEFSELDEFNSKPNPTIKDLGNLIASLLGRSIRSSQPSQKGTEDPIDSSESSPNKVELPEIAGKPIETREVIQVSDPKVIDLKAMNEVMLPNPKKVAITATALKLHLSSFIMHRMFSSHGRRKRTTPTKAAHQRVPNRKVKKKATDKKFYGPWKTTKTKSDAVRSVESLKKKKKHRHTAKYRARSMRNKLMIDFSAV